MKKSTEIVFLSHYKPCASGYADYVFHLVNSLAELRPEHGFMVLGCSCVMRYADAKINAKIEKKNVLINRIFKKNSLSSLAKIINFLAKSRVENLYIHYPLELFTGFILAPVLNLILPLLFLPLLLTKGIRLIVNLDSIHKPYQGGLKERAFLLLQLTTLKLLQSVGAVIVCRNIVAWKLLTSMGFSEKLTRYIPHGTPCNVPIAQDRANEMRTRLGLSEGPVISYWGYISRYKGINYLIRAIKYVIGEYPNVKLVIAGDYFNPLDKYKPKKHRYLPYLRDLVRSLELEDKVIFVTRHLTEDEVDSLIASSDIVVLPYITKNLSASGVLARVMSHGKPVVVTDCGWFIGYVLNGVNGIVVPQGDERALAEAILRLLRDPQLRSKLMENMRRMANGFKWSNVTRRWLKIFEECKGRDRRDAR